MTETERVTTFAIPRCEPLRSLWLRKIPTDFSKLKNPFVCVKHFNEDDVIRTESLIIKGKLKLLPRKIPKLKKNSVPCIFPNTPQYLSSVPSSSYRLVDAEEKNFENAINKNQKDHEKYREKDIINSLMDIVKKLKKKLELENKWSLLKSDTKIVLCLIDIANEVPTVSGSITINNTLEFQIYNGNIKLTKLPNPKLNKLSTFNVLEEIMSFVEQQVAGNIGGHAVEHSKNVINSEIEKLKLHPELEISPFLNFFLEQLQLCTLPKNNRRYCNKTMIFSATLYVHSPSAYNALLKSGFLCLPHPRNLRKLICNFTMKGHGMEGSILYLKH